MSAGLPARLSVVTLGVRDLPRLRDFYVALGWALAVDTDEFAAFRTRGAVLTLYRLENLLSDTGAPDPGAAGGFTLAVNVDERDQVDEAIAAAREAGARIAREVVDEEWGGRTGNFVDPEENYWEVAWVPPDSEMAELLRQAAT
jgi:catechol 2,3-dioxygenase-like lactoylglutathione lyase family enzyme